MKLNIRRKHKQQLALLLLAGMLLLLITQYRQSEQPIPGSELATKTAADYFMQGAHLSLFDEQGHLKSQLSAERVEVFESSKQSRLFRPRLTSSEAAHQGWQLTAPEGLLDETNEQLRLNDKVVVTWSRRQPPMTSSLATSSPMPTNNLETPSPEASIDLRRIETKDLLIDFAKNQAETAAAVVITADNIVTRGQGLKLDLKQRRFSILSQVETLIYER